MILMSNANPYIPQKHFRDSRRTRMTPMPFPHSRNKPCGHSCFHRLIELRKEHWHRTMKKIVSAVFAAVGVVYLTFWKSPPQLFSDRNLATFNALEIVDKIYGPDTDADHEYQDYRFLTFGTSKTWGSMLENRSWAYPFLLSKNVTNLAIRAAGPETPAICTYSLVGDNIYDVIVIEFFFHANDYLIRLARRLRQRFPKAAIFFLIIWSPFQFEYIGDGEDHGKSLKAIIEERRLGDQSLKTYFNIVENTQSSDWRYFIHPIANAALEQAIEEVGGIKISQDLDPKEVRPYLAKHGGLFHFDTVHFSPYGHRWMRNAILTALRALKVEQHDEVNDWAAKDECHNFYTDGDLRGMLKDPALVLNQFQDDKWALEMDSNNNNNNNNNSTWIKVVNSLDHPAEVVLSYMSMGPISTSYPTVRVEVSRASDDGGGVRIVPYEKERAYPVHVVQQKGVGVIPPGHSKMTITVLKPNQDPFRIVGIMITPREIPMPVVGA